MEFFDNEYELNSDNEARNKQIYEENWTKIYKTMRMVILIVFSTIGFIFLLVGLILLLISQDFVSDEFLSGAILLGIGLLFLILGLVSFLVIPKKANYERFKKRIFSANYIINFRDLAIIVQILSKEVLELEEKNNELEERIKKLEKNN